MSFVDSCIWCIFCCGASFVVWCDKWRVFLSQVRLSWFGVSHLVGSITYGLVRLRWFCVFPLVRCALCGLVHLTWLQCCGSGQSLSGSDLEVWIRIRLKIRILNKNLIIKIVNLSFFLSDPDPQHWLVRCVSYGLVRLPLSGAPFGVLTHLIWSDESLVIWCVFLSQVHISLLVRLTWSGASKEFVLL